LQQLRIGTRGSPLALAQAHEVRDRLRAAHPALRGADAIAIVVVSTRGDRVLDRPLAEIGGKGLFTEEIEEGLRQGALDLAVHSMKDMPTALPAGLCIPCLLPREDPRDVLIVAGGGGGALADLPPGARVGTSGLRRAAQIRALRPDLRVVGFRGNVQTRLRKLADGEADVTLLALAGLRRLGMAAVGAPLAVEELLPAVAQGAIGVECRADDEATLALLAPLRCAETMACVAAERAMLAALDGSCRTPIAGLAVREPSGALWLRGLLAREDGSAVWRAEARGAEPEALGAAVAAALRRAAGSGSTQPR
jgi:hydroxymethylbilane synthase